LFPELSRKFVKKGADFLVNITNDAWYKKTSAGEQHFQASVFRAVENRSFLLRSANTGVSGFISPYGRIISLVQNKNAEKIFISGFDTQEILIPKVRVLSFYTNYGDIFIFLLYIFVIYSIFQLIK
jgi:apolipoprotein N-acyltransferase